MWWMLAKIAAAKVIGDKIGAEGKTPSASGGSAGSSIPSMPDDSVSGGGSAIPTKIEPPVNLYENSIQMESEQRQKALDNAPKMFDAPVAPPVETNKAPQQKWGMKDILDIGAPNSVNLFTNQLSGDRALQPVEQTSKGLYKQGLKQLYQSGRNERERFTEIPQLQRTAIPPDNYGW